MNTLRKYLLMGTKYVGGSNLFGNGSLFENSQHSFFEKTEEQAVKKAKEWAIKFDLSNLTFFGEINLGDTVGMLASQKKKYRATIHWTCRGDFLDDTKEFDADGDNNAREKARQIVKELDEKAEAEAKEKGERRDSFPLFRLY